MDMQQSKPESEPTASKPASSRRRPATKDPADAGRLWTGDRVSVGEGHPALPIDTPGPGSVPVIQPAPQAGEAVPEGEARWYVVHAYSGHEEKVRNNLLKRVESMDMHDRIFDVLVPTEDVIEIKDGQRRHVAKRTYPGYILVNMIMSDESWYVVRNTPGVTSFVGSGNKPVPLQEKEIKSIQRQIQLEAAKATPAPPVGTALGPHGVNIMEFVKSYNDRTASMGGQVIPVEITIFEDRTFTFVTKTPPAAALLKKAAGVEKGSAKPNKEKVGKVTRQQVRDIAQLKLKDLNAYDVEAAMKMVEGTARSLGIEVAS